MQFVFGITYQLRVSIKFRLLKPHSTHSQLVTTADIQLILSFLQPLGGKETILIETIDNYCSGFSRY
jgi:hypothetical protein